MMDHEPLQEILRDWKAPEPPATMDEWMRVAYRAAHPAPRRRSLWQSFWNLRISIPVPALAVALVLLLALMVEFRPAPVPVASRADGGYVTRLDDTGFQPLPNGAARVVSVGAIQQ